MLTYDSARFWCGPTSPDDFSKTLERIDGQAQINRGLKSIADKHGEPIHRRFPRIKRRVSGYNIDRLLPEDGFNVAQRCKAVFVAAGRQRNPCGIKALVRTCNTSSPAPDGFAVFGYR